MTPETREAVTRCPACAGSSKPLRIAVVTDRSYVVHRCRSCALAFTSPRPTADELATFYGSEYFRKSEDGGTQFGYADYEGESWAGVNARRTWEELPGWVPEVALWKAGRLLDVGSATGEFPASAARDGWDAVACEIGTEARAAAAAKGLSTVSTIDEATGSFHLITMFHVLEHVIDPVATLQAARSLIEPNGRLVIELPNWNSAGRVVRRDRWAQLRPPEHINFFTAASLRSAAVAAGWVTVRDATIYPYAASTARAAVQRRAPREFLTGGVQVALGKAGLGGYLRLVAAPDPTLEGTAPLTET